MVELTAERLRELLEYNPDDGEFKWRKSRRGARPAKAHAGNTRPDGYKRIGIDGTNHLAHRLAWLYVHGAWPQLDVDHIDGDPGNNRISNLRDVTTSTNVQNIKAAKRSNKRSGLLGVSYHARDSLWRARITVEGVTMCVGYFKDPDSAHAAYIEAKRRLHQGNTI